MFLHGWRAGLAGAALLALLPLGASAQEPPKLSVDDILRTMTRTLAEASALTLHVEKTFDETLADGLTVQYSGALDIALRRPDRFYVSYGDDLSAKEAWYDGKSLILYDHNAEVYGELGAEATIETTIEAVREKYDLALPLGTLLSGNTQEVIEERAERRIYLGLHDVEGTPAHHVIVTAPDMTWQFWIDAGDVPLPLRIVVTFLDEPGEPRSSFLFTDWNLEADLPDELFMPKIPETAALAAFLPSEGD